jgi:hypothetical protein
VTVPLSEKFWSSAGPTVVGAPLLLAGSAVWAHRMDGADARPAAAKTNPKRKIALICLALLRESPPSTTARLANARQVAGLQAQVR